jgi:hypothetical protein
MTYPKLSSLLSTHPALQIFQHFSELNIKSLLYYQAELAQLATDLAEVEKEDAECGESPRSLYQRTFWRLRACETQCKLPQVVGQGAALEQSDGPRTQGQDGGDNIELMGLPPIAGSTEQVANVGSRAGSAPDSTRSTLGQQQNDDNSSEDGSESMASLSLMQQRREQAAQRQWKLVCQIRVLLKEYCKLSCIKYDSPAFVGTHKSAGCLV